MLEIERRIVIIPFLHGKVEIDGTLPKSPILNAIASCLRNGNWLFQTQPFVGSTLRR